MAIPCYGVKRDGQELIQFLPAGQIRIDVGQQVAVGRGVFGTEIDDVRAVAGGDPASHGGIKVAPAAGKDFERHAGMRFLERREGGLAEPVHRVFGQTGDVDFEAFILSGNGNGENGEYGYESKEKKHAFQGWLLS